MRKILIALLVIMPIVAFADDAREMSEGGEGRGVVRKAPLEPRRCLEGGGEVVGVTAL